VASILGLLLIFMFVMTNAGEMFAVAKRFSEVLEDLTEHKTITDGQSRMYMGNCIITAAGLFGAFYFLATFIDALPSVVMLIGD